jgi:oxygen-independent coproporphyrinogen III oxidase
VRRETPSAAFAAAVGVEWRARLAAGDLLGGGELQTLYFGGGTPSRLDPVVLASLINTFRTDVPPSATLEVTMEANPDDVTDSNAAQWAAAGVTRVSLGVQSHDPAVLAWMHRTHRAEQVVPAVASLRKAGIADVSMDLIFALPDALQRDWREDLARTIALEPTHISMYGLTIEPHTPLARWTERGTAAPTSDDRYADEYLEAHSALGEAGLTFYEVSNAARPGFRSRHNSAYWSGADYIGLGPSAHSLLRGSRSWNVRDWADYQRRSLAGEPVAGGDEVLDLPARELEGLYLGLRSDLGVELGQLAPSAAKRWVTAGWARTSADRLFLTVEGWLRLDALVAGARDS